jgi:hypothetical protein
VIACARRGALDPLGRMRGVRVGEMTGRLLDAAARLCDNRLVPYEGAAGRSRSAARRGRGLGASAIGPVAYLDQVTGQELQPHQREAVESATRLVAGVPS